MPLEVVKTSQNYGKCEVTIESETYSELTGLDAKKMAISEGMKHLGATCGLSGSTGPYPVDLEGKEITDFSKFAGVKEEEARSRFRYRNDFKLSPLMAF